MEAIFVQRALLLEELIVGGCLFSPNGCVDLMQPQPIS